MLSGADVYGNYKTGVMSCNICRDHSIKVIPIEEYKNIKSDYFCDMIHHLKEKHGMLIDKGPREWKFIDDDSDWGFILDEHTGEYELLVYKACLKVNNTESKDAGTGQYKLYNTNIGPERAQKAVEELVEKGVLMEDIIMKMNKKGNFAMWYKRIC